MGAALEGSAPITMRFWTGAQAKCRGRDHLKTGAPCQDRTYLLKRKGVTSIALADGAGSRSLSHIGAELAVESVAAAMALNFDGLSKGKRGAMARELYRTVLEKLEARAKEEGRSPGDLACTLLAVAIRGDRYLACHIGDGAIVQVTKKGPKVLSHPEGGEFANQTFFLTGKDGEPHFRLYRGKLSPSTAGFVLMSDGSAQSLYRRADRSAASGCAAMVEWCSRASGREVSRALEENLKRSLSMRTGDDCSLAVLGKTELSLEGLNSLDQPRRMELLGTTSKSYDRIHRAFVEDLEVHGGIQSVRERAIRLEVSTSTVQRHRERFLWEGLSCM